MRRSLLLFALVALTLAGCPPPLHSCGDACYLEHLYCCQNGQLTQKQFCNKPDPKPQPTPGGNCPADLHSCGQACYRDTDYCCIAGVLTQKQFCKLPIPTKNPQPAPTKNDPKPNPNPTPDPDFRNRADLTVVNHCHVDLFIEARMGGQGRPLPGHDKTTIKLPIGQSIGYNIPDTGADGTRFWAKYGCNADGRNCLIGESQQYWPNPPGGCPPGGCHIPVDSLFEATWGCKPGAACNGQNPTTWFDTSQVDGWTVPYKVNLFGDTGRCDCDVGQCRNLTVIDGSKLDLKRCPTGDDASWGGRYPSFQGKSMSGLDLRVISNGLLLGCMSPCKKLTYGAPQGYGINEGTIPAVYMCCPTPNPANCRIDQGCIMPKECREGPIEQSQFVKAIHDMAPGIYSYSYDDGVGLHTCPAGVVKYQMEFCPPGSTDYPIKI